MKVVNNYAPSERPVVLQDPKASYDLNFRFPVQELESGRVKLTPLIPSIHGVVLSKAIKQHPELLQYLPWSPESLVDSYEVHYESLMRSDPSWQGLNPIYRSWFFLLLSNAQLTSLIAVAHALAGAMGYLNAAPELASVEIGYAIILPTYQRTFVSTHAIGLLLRYALDQPLDGGLGLRRVQWQAHADNAPSIRAAQRMGMKLEGIMRWQRPWPCDKKDARRARDGDAASPMAGRHSAMLAMCWDDWETSGRAHVLKMMSRTS